MDRQPIISAKDVEITFSLRGKKLNAIRKCSLDLYDGETLAIVGESGSGKSVFTKTFVGMLDVNGKITGGSIMYEGRDMTKFTEKDWLGVRGKKIAMVMQDPMTSLNPLLLEKTDTIATFVYRSAIVNGQFESASAITLYQSIFGFFLVLGSNLLVKKFDPDYALF